MNKRILIQCPVCRGSLVYQRIDDGEIEIKVSGNTDNWELEELVNDSNGSTAVYCENDRTHVIPNELWGIVANIVE